MLNRYLLVTPDCHGFNLFFFFFKPNVFQNVGEDIFDCLDCFVEFFFFSAEMTGPTKFIKKKQNFKLER